MLWVCRSPGLWSVFLGLPPLCRSFSFYLSAALSLSLLCLSHIASGLPSCVNNTAWFRGAWDLPPLGRERCHELQVLMKYVRVDPCCWGTKVSMQKYGAENVTSYELQPIALVVFYSCSKLETGSLQNVWRGFWFGEACWATQWWAHWSAVPARQPQMTPVSTNYQMINCSSIAKYNSAACLINWGMPLYNDLLTQTMDCTDWLPTTPPCMAANI